MTADGSEESSPAKPAWGSPPDRGERSPAAPPWGTPDGEDMTYYSPDKDDLANGDRRVVCADETPGMTTSVRNSAP